MSQLTREQIIDKAMAAPHVRAMVIERADAAEGEDSRTVDLAFASDTPITHFSWSQWRYIDIKLSMDAGAVRTARLENGAPLLADHNAKDQIGVIESFSFDADGKARAKVRFSRSARGEEIYRDVLDGIRKNVSVGFMIHKLVLEEERDKKKGEIDLYRADDWEPYEVSIVAMPADISVGVGRGFELPAKPISEEPAEERQNPTTEKTMEENKNNPPAPPAVDERQNALAAAREVREWGEVLGEQDAASAYLRETGDKANKDGFMSFLRGRQTATPTAPVLPAAEEAARQGAPTQLARSLPRHGAIRSFKGEDAAEKAYRFGQFIRASILGLSEARDFCSRNGIEITKTLGETRAMSEGVNETGGFLVPVEFSNDLIDLREQFGVFRRNAKVAPMSTDTLVIPRRTGGLTAYFGAEAAAMTASDKAWDQVELVTKKLYAYARYSTELSEDAVISIGDDLASEIAYAFAEKEDQCGFNGDGTSTYGGIVGVREKLKGLSGTIANIAGLQVGSGNSYSELTLADFEGVVARLPQYADSDMAAWFVHRQFYWNVMVKVMLASGGVTAAEIEDARRQRFLGYRVEFSQVMPKAEANSQVCAVFGDLAKAAVMGSRRDTTIAMSEHSRFANDQIEIRGTERFDINVHSVGNAAAAAADQVAGPVVGLITAAA